MNPLEFDTGPLTWVKSEIDLALSSAQENLTAFTNKPSDTTQLKFCQTHLHQATGAIQMVGLEGLARFSEEIEKLIAAVDSAEIPADDPTLKLLDDAIASVSDYLNGLLNNEPDVPLKLFPMYRTLCEARGVAKISEADLFFPDLSLRAPKSEESTLLALDKDFSTFVRRERSRYQRGLLEWLRNQNNKAGLQAMVDATQTIERVRSLPVHRTFWWVVVGFMESLLGDGLAPEVYVKHLCARIDQQMRRLGEGSPKIAERVLRDVLYFLARSAPVSDRIIKIKQVFGLEHYLPSEREPVAEPVQKKAPPALRELRELLESAKEAWLKVTTGNEEGLESFKRQLERMLVKSPELDHAQFQQLLEKVYLMFSNPRAQTMTDTLAMEVATTLLLLENFLSDYPVVSAEFIELTKAQTQRLESIAKGETVEPANKTAPTLGDVSRKAQEKLLVSQICAEIQTNLQEIERVLDSFFRNAANRQDLPGLRPLLSEIVGAFKMLEINPAAQLIMACQTLIDQISDPEYKAANNELELLADALSSLGFFVDALQKGRPNLFKIIEPAYTALVGGASIHVSPVPQNQATLSAPEASVEGGLLGQKQNILVHFNKWEADPNNAVLRDALREALVRIQQDAELVMDVDLKNSAVTTYEIFDKASAPNDELTNAINALTAPKMAMVEPSAAVSKLLLASAEAIDAELIDTYLEEADEVLGTVTENLRIARENPYDKTALTTIRRGFHTLKGSGRMVGLTTLGEVAWNVEQVLNKWLQQEKNISPELLNYIGTAQQAFEHWVSKLKNREAFDVDASALTGLASSLYAELEKKPAAIANAPEQQLTAPLSSKLSVSKPEPHDQEKVAEAPLPAETSGVLPTPALEGKAEPARKAVSDALFELFLNESKQHLATLRENFGKLGNTSDTPISHEFIRAAHTLCSISRTVGLEPLADLSYGLEQWLLELMRHPEPLNARRHKVMGEVIDALAQAIEAAERNELVNPPKKLTRSLQAVLRQTRARYPGERKSIGEEMDSLVQPSPETPAAKTAPAVEVSAQPPLIEEKPTPSPQIEVASAPEEIPAALARPTALKREASVVIQDDIDVELLPTFIEEAQDLTPLIGKELREWRAHRDNPQFARSLQRALHTFKGSARMAGAMRLGELIHNLETHVSAAANESITPALLDEFDAEFDQIVDSFEQVQRQPMAPATAEAAASAEPTAAIATTTDVSPAPAAAAVPEEVGVAAALRVRADIVDQLVNEAGEVTITRSRIEGEMKGMKQSLSEMTDNVNRLRIQLREAEIQAETQIQSRLSQARDIDETFDPLEFDRFTRLQELTRMMAESVNDVAMVQQNLLKHLYETELALVQQGRMSRDLQQELLRIRMVPLSSIAQRLYRIVRRTLKDVGKKANLEIRGGQVELDRSVLEKVTAPLEHLLRNAVAHGLEERTLRLKNGKPESGEITLQARQESNEVILSLTDDGAGLDLPRIRKRAIENRLIKKDAEITDQQLMELIFTPGFTTAEEITQLSGRGIGLDVVRSEIAALGGRILVASEKGKSTTFTIYLPLTLATTQVVLVRAGTRTYALPAAMVETVQELKREQLVAIHNQQTISWNDNVYRVRYLNHLLGDHQAQPETQPLGTLIFLRSGEQRAAIHVDERMGNQELVVKNIGPQLARVPGIAGASVLNNGRVVLIINPALLAYRDGLSAIVPKVLTTDIAEAVPAKSVMIVDDSITVRKVTSRLLTKEGYQFTSAKDGVDALEQLKEGLPDIMLVDIEMPRMDGFELVKHIRGDAKTAHIPIIMITSRSAEKHRNYAKELGVNVYLGKPYQEEELLDNIARLTGTPQQS